MNKTLICLGGGIEAVPIIERAKALGCMVVVVDIDGRCPARYISDIYVQESCYHSEQTIGALHEIADEAEGTYDGVLCCAVDAPLVAAEIAAEFGLPGLGVEAAKLGQDKFAQKWCLHSADILVPKFMEIFNSGAAGYFTGESGFNDLLKPIDSRGGRGVVRLLPDVDPAFAYEVARANSPTGRVMVEEWLDGPQLSTESIVQDGRVLFTAIGLRNYARLDEFAPYVIEDGFDEPFGNTPMQDEISELIKKAARALNWYQQGSGTIKGDLVIHDGRIYIIELASRLSGGFFATHGHKLAYHADYIGIVIESALGYPVNTKEHNLMGGFQCVSQRYVFPNPEDVGKTVKCLPNIMDARFIMRTPFDIATWNIRPGQVIEAVTSHPQRWGQALATGRAPDEARQRAEQAVAAMKAGIVLE